MRILMLSNLYPPEVEGGAEILAGEIAEGLVRQGHDVHVLSGSSRVSAMTPGPQVRRTLQLAGAVRVDRSRPLWRQLDLPFHYYRRFHQPANAQELRRVVAETRPDVLYIWEITGLGVTSLLDTLPDLRLPVVFHLGSYSLLYLRSPETAQSQLRAQWLKRWLIGAIPRLPVTSFIAVSAAVKAEYVRGGFDPQRIEVIPNGIAQRFLESPPRRVTTQPDGRSAPIRLLCVGRLCPEKGILTALKAMVLLTENAADFRLDIVGEGDAAYTRELRGFVREQRLDEHVTFHGRMPQDELIRYYDRADILLNTALWQEPFGLTTIEAMARLLPVIASRVGGAREIVVHGVNGLLTEPDDEHALASAIQQLASDPAQRARLADAGHHLVAERFTVEENATRVARHLQRAVRNFPVATATDTCEAPDGARRIVG